MPQNARDTAFTVFELLRENQQGGKITTTPPPPPRPLRLRLSLTPYVYFSQHGRAVQILLDCELHK